ncbi:M23 family metallopeptidase [Sphingomonas asaccharolytica]|uniref:M23 family metallopeptidase n=1 Tax=Sphingomonas asaccharolytica TaxID=40681 RepID=UPI000836B73D|nr:M23 family metallopeptidase [Sphingomonas asaccharolytica]
MFLRSEHYEQSGGAAPSSTGRALILTTDLSFADRLRASMAQVDWTPDLGARIGSRDWFRGLATCTALIGACWALSPGIGHPLVAASALPLKGKAWENARAQSIAPLALGADTGQRMAATDLVRPLAETPDRPTQAFASAMSDGDSLATLLRRAGAAKTDIVRVADLVAGALPLDNIRPGTRFEGVLGRREKKSDPRPLEQLSFQPAFDFRLTIKRTANGLTMDRQAIAVDDTPLRIQGLAGSSLYKSMRAAGVPSTVAADYIKAIATRISIGGDVASDDTWDVMLSQRRAATGEVELGKILFAGLDMGRRKVQLVKWSRNADEDEDEDDGNGHGDWYDASGQTERQGFMGLPVAGRISSSFGMRLHPILGYYRMHKGIDIACAYGSPVYAVFDGIVNWAGYKGGYGSFVGIRAQGGGVGTGYGHLSRVLVRNGEHVHRGQIVAYSGNSGLSTGPHLHFEVYRSGQVVNPRGFSFSSVAALTGAALRAFKSHVSELLSVHPGTPRKSG